MIVSEENLARGLATAINPLFVLFMLGAPILKGSNARPSSRNPGCLVRHYLRCLSGVGIAVILAEVGKRKEIWPGHPWFPSGHETFAAAAATCLIVYDRRWAVVTLPLLPLLAWALINAGFHTLPDIIGALVLGPAIVLPIAYLLRIRKK